MIMFMLMMDPHKIKWMMCVKMTVISNNTALFLTVLVLRFILQTDVQTLLIQFWFFSQELVRGGCFVFVYFSLSLLILHWFI